MPALSAKVGRWLIRCAAVCASGRRRHFRSALRAEAGLGLITLATMWTCLARRFGRIRESLLDRASDGPHGWLRTAGQVIDDVLVDRRGFFGDVSGHRSQIRELAHPPTDGQQRHSHERAPKISRRLKTAERREKIADADDREAQADDHDRRPSVSQEIAQRRWTVSHRSVRTARIRRIDSKVIAHGGVLQEAGPLSGYCTKLDSSGAANSWELSG